MSSHLRTGCGGRRPGNTQGAPPEADSGAEKRGPESVHCPGLLLGPRVPGLGSLSHGHPHSQAQTSTSGCGNDRTCVCFCLDAPRPLFAGRQGRREQEGRTE